jgi:hypothetical protein
VSGRRQVLADNNEVGTSRLHNQVKHTEGYSQFGNRKSKKNAKKGLIAACAQVTGNKPCDLSAGTWHTQTSTASHGSLLSGSLATC